MQVESSKADEYKTRRADGESLVYALVRPDGAGYFYVGKTIDPLDRLEQHLGAFRHLGWTLQMDELEWCSRSDAGDAEIKWYYLLKEAGNELANEEWALGSGRRKGFGHTEETRKRMSKPKRPGHNTGQTSAFWAERRRKKPVYECSCGRISNQSGVNAMKHFDAEGHDLVNSWCVLAECVEHEWYDTYRGGNHKRCKKCGNTVDSDLSARYNKRKQREQQRRTDTEHVDHD